MGDPGTDIAGENASGDTPVALFGSWSCCLPLFASIVYTTLFFVFCTLQVRADDANPAFPTDEVIQYVTVGPDRLAGHIVWATSSLTLTALCLAGSAICLVGIHKSRLPATARRRLWVTSLAYGIPLTAAYVVLPRLIESGAWQNKVIDGVLSDVHIRATTIIQDSCVCVLITLINAYAGALLGVRSPVSDRDLLARALGRSARQASLLLVMGSIVLIAGVVEVYALFSWGTSSLPAPYVDYGTQTTRAMLIGTGAFFSLLLAIVYLVPMLSIRVRAAELNERGELPSKEHAEWLKEHGLTSRSIWASVTRLAAILAPLATGVLGERVLDLAKG